MLHFVGDGAYRQIDFFHAVGNALVQRIGDVLGLGLRPQLVLFAAGAEKKQRQQQDRQVDADQRQQHQAAQATVVSLFVDLALDY